MPDVLVLTNIGHSFCLCHHKTQPMPAGYQEKNGIHVILWHYISKSAPQNSAFLAQNQRFRRWITGVAVEDGSDSQSKYLGGIVKRSLAMVSMAIRKPIAKTFG